MSISDEVFRKDLDKALKQQGLIKKDRNALIDHYMMFDVSERDMLLDHEEKKSRDIIAKKKQDKIIPSEKWEQIKLIEEFEKKYPDEWIYCQRNDGYRLWQEKSEQILMGVRKGVSDLFIPGFKIFLEMKRIKGSVQSEHQIEFQKFVESKGYFYVLGYGWIDALAKIDAIVEKNKNKT